MKLYLNNFFLTLIISFTLFTAAPLHSRTESISNDLDHLLGRSYYIIQQDNDKIVIIIFPRLTTDITGKVSIETYSGDTVSFIKQQLEKKYNTAVTIENPGYVPPHMIDEAIRKNQMRIILLSALCGTFLLFAGFIIFRSFKLKNTGNR